ncbi:MAG: hypothetical protein QM655_11225 [Nocardioidaceae bacterium]
MLVPRLIARLTTRLTDQLTTWPVTSQHNARRNALVAATALTQLRIEREDAAAYLDAATARHRVRTA